MRSEPRTHMLRVHFSDEEWTALQEHAHAAGMTMSALVRELGLEVLRAGKNYITIKTDMEEQSRRLAGAGKTAFERIGRVTAAGFTEHVRAYHAR